MCMCVPELDAGKDCSGTNSNLCKSGTKCEGDACSKCCLVYASYFTDSFFFFFFVVRLFSFF